MRIGILSFVLLTSLTSRAQSNSGFYFLLYPNEPLLYSIYESEEIYDYTEESGYEDLFFSATSKEFRPCRGLDMDFGYQFSSGINLGTGVRVVSDMLDPSFGFNAVADIGYTFNFPIALHGRSGFYWYSGHSSYSVGGLFDIFFPIESNRFDFGLRTGYNYVPVYKNDEYTYTYSDSKDTFRRSMTYHYIELGMFFRWH